MFANVLKAEGLNFEVMTPSGGVRLQSERSRDDAIEMELDGTADPPQPLVTVTRSRGSRVTQSDRLVKGGTPLAGLKSQAELALAEASDPALKARLQRVQESAARAAHLVAQLLTLARAEPESAAVQARTRFDVQKLVRDLTAEQVPRALHAGVDLGYDDSHPEPLEILGNALLIREALLNLIDNAVRYAGRGATVTVRALRDELQDVADRMG